MSSYFGEKMKYYRKKKKWSLEKLAEKIDSSKQVLSRYERGERVPRISFAKAIADALEVELTDMVDMDEINESPAVEIPSSVQQLLEFAKTVPEDKAAQVLRIMKAILASETK